MTIRTIIESMICVIIIVLTLGIVGYNETHYTRVGNVIDVESDNAVIVQDQTGNEWAFYSDTDYSINDEVKMTMCTNGTDTIITDDEVVNVTKVS